MDISFKQLFEYCQEKNFDKVITENGNEVFRLPKNHISILRFFDIYTEVVAVSRHYTTKDKFRLAVYNFDDKKTYVIETTDDHTCITMSTECFHQNTKASKLKIGDLVPLRFGNDDVYGSIQNIENLGAWNDYVYDMEVNDGGHCYYANNILMHNSQFINIAPMVDHFIKENKCSATNIKELEQEDLDKLIKEVDDFINNEVNPYISELINNECHTTQGHNLKYSREYIASEAMFFKKKHYIVHIIKKDDKTVDQFKYSGVSVKKAEIPSDMKPYLKTIFEDTCINRWNETTYKNFIDKIYDEFLKKDYENISIYKTYNTEKAVKGFLEYEKGAGAHARSANIYNQLLDNLKLGNKYDKINVGEQLRYCYVHPENPFGIDVIGFKDYMPQEFKDIFSINYEVMFDKIFLSSLRGYTEIMKFNKYSPNNKSMFDINSI